jgi:hypothetical protein
VTLLTSMYCSVPCVTAAEECTSTDALRRSQQIQATCCQSHADCSSGFPTVCNPVCADLFLPFFEECHEVLRDIVAVDGPGQGAHDQLQVYDTFRDKCLAGMATPYSICDAATAVVTAPRGALIDGSGSQHGSNTRCSVLLQAPVGQRVALKFLRANIDPLDGPWIQRDNFPDFVKLYDGPDEHAPQITWLSGMNLDPSTWVSKTNQMYISFSAGYQATVTDFEAVWVFSGSGASCSLTYHKDLLEVTPDKRYPQLPALATSGTCSTYVRQGGLMSSGQSCTLGCTFEDGHYTGIKTDLVSNNQGDVAPTYNLLRNMVVCFDGTLDVHSFTCESQRTPVINICQPPHATISHPSGRISDGSGSVHGSSNGKVLSNSDCGILLQAGVMQRIAVRFSAFDVSHTDSLTLYDGEDESAPVIAKLFGDFTCAENTRDCDDQSGGREVEAGVNLTASMVGGYASTGRSMFVHFQTRRMRQQMTVGETEGFTLQYMQTNAGRSCMLDAHPLIRAPSFGQIGDCTAAVHPAGLKTGFSCSVACDAGLRSSAEVDPALWRTIHYLGPSISVQPMCWNGVMVNRGGIHCLQANTCVNWELGNTPTLAVACEIFANEAPYPGRTGKYDECASPNCQDEDIRGLGDNVWYKLAVTTGQTYTLTTRLGSATFTWLYLIDSDGSTELASCIYCRRNPDGSENNHDMSSTLTYTALATSAFAQTVCCLC